MFASLTSKHAFALALTTLTASAAFADVQPVGEKDTSAHEAATNANFVYMIKNMRTPEKAYKLVSLDSKLNGDVSTTTVLLVGEEVGGEAGYDAAFILTPSADHTLVNADSAQVMKNEIQVTFHTLDGSRVRKLYRYDAKSNVLKERAAPASTLPTKTRK